MNLIEKILLESKTNKQLFSIRKTLTTLISKYKDGVKLVVNAYTLNDEFNYIVLESIYITDEKRNKGLGTKIMKELTNIADNYQVPIQLTPSKHFGSNLNRLIKFYESFGFKLNKGKNKDYRFSYSMVRFPK